MSHVAMGLHQHEDVSSLRYATDQEPGIVRRRSGRGFSYRRPDGRVVRDRETLARIRSLAIPPAWTEVWISTRVNGHVQATGRDARGRKQHRYHPDWTRVRDEAKYARLAAFGRALPALRRRTTLDLALPGLPRRKVVALVVRLLEATLIRIGNDEYARHNRSYGLTTILDRHATISGRQVRFHFRGKSGKDHDVAVDDARLARLVRQCQELPGSQLFQYRDERHRVCDIGSGDVNRYLRDTMGAAFTAKDFRTWAGTVLATRTLLDLAQSDAAPPRPSVVVEAVDIVARDLRNTRAVCRRCYIHPRVIDAYMDGSLARSLQPRGPAATPRRVGSRRFEAAVLALLSRPAARQRTRRRAQPRASTSASSRVALAA